MKPACFGTVAISPGPDLLDHDDGLVMDLAKRETVAMDDANDWLAQHTTDPGEPAGHRQREIVRENGPQSE
jgi:hypothetical protein